MHYLVYISATTHLFSEAELKELLIKSRVNNKQLGITGLLLYHEGNIIQVLEGEEANVRFLYEKIRKDSRHQYIHKLIEGAIQERNFPDWSMGLRPVSSQEMESILGYKKIAKGIIFMQSCRAAADGVQERIQILLRTFVENNMRIDMG